jgi:uncharacterized protein (DUF2267 family)
MDYNRFISLVQERARVKTAVAANAIRATFETLGERLGATEAHALAAQLPRRIADYLDEPLPEKGTPFSFGEFCRRVAEREACEVQDAIQHVRCVFDILKKAVTGGEMNHVRELLPEEFSPLFGPAPVPIPVRRQ